MDSSTKKLLHCIFEVIVSSIECKNQEVLIDLVKTAIENDVNISQLIENNKFLFKEPEQKSYRIDDDFYGYVTWINCLTRENFIEIVIQNFNDDQFIQLIKEMIEKDLLENDKKKIAKKFVYKENSYYHFINSSLNSQLTNGMIIPDYLDFKNSIEEELMKNKFVEDRAESNLKSNGQLINKKIYNSMLNDYINEKVDKHKKMIEEHLSCGELSVSFDSEQLDQNKLDKIILPQVEQQTVVTLVSDEGKLISIYSKKSNISFAHPPKNNTMLLFNENGIWKECNKSSFLFINNNQINFCDRTSNSLIELNDTTINTEFKGEILDFIGESKWNTIRIIIYNKSLKTSTVNNIDKIPMPVPSNNKVLKIVLENRFKVTNIRNDYKIIKELYNIKSPNLRLDFYVQTENNIVGLCANENTISFFEYDLNEIDKQNAQNYSKNSITRYFQKTSYNNFAITPPDPVISFDTPGFILITPLFSISNQLIITKYPFNSKLYSPMFQSNSFFIREPISQKVIDIAYRVTDNQ
ncbi:hypothetical protein ENUP19_0054G0096 [Entamoeba nuttalli]|uniref:Uncharacterized protein n=2 Tax=Entamoeba nuttalli TaxID=412467 RepID=K2H4V7_ENTNP|nr:hypothetical protein ENU1_056800 [Entamoeba nuttalli P19]EKE41417.1 hypothetical protein ENU1_056800 [Entamoeba nuttalli P19]|eukprot:XP_008856249.1 hypothetical protein ENU1_056800 [Entamoeba nuttalli P19]